MPISLRVETFVRECQWFAGESSLVTNREDQLRLVRTFVVRLPDSTDRAEMLIFRGILVDVAFKWARHACRRFHSQKSAKLDLVSFAEALASWQDDGTKSYKRAFERWAVALLEGLERSSPVSPAARAKEIIDHRFADALQLKDLARMTGSTEVRLRTLFKQEFGITLREYRTRARVLNAAKQVQDSSVKIEAIAAAAGFRSKRNFYNAFRRIVGCTPSQVRHRPTPMTIASTTRPLAERVAVPSTIQRQPRRSQTHTTSRSIAHRRS